MRNLVEVSTFTTPIPVPENGEPVAAEQRDPALQALANRTKFLDDARGAHDGRIAAVEAWDADNRLDTLEARFDGSGEVVLPAPLAGTIYIGGRSLCRVAEAHWVRLSPGGAWESRLDRAPGYFDLTPRVSRHASFSKLRVLVLPGVARALVGNRIVAKLQRSSFGVSFAAPAITDVEVATATDDGTANLQWITIDLSGAPVAVSVGQTWQILIECGNDASSNFDQIHAVALEMQTTKIGII